MNTLRDLFKQYRVQMSMMSCHSVLAFRFHEDANKSGMIWQVYECGTKMNSIC